MTTRLDRRYDQLSPAERVAAIVSAKARGDDEERRRLFAKIPRVSALVADPETFDLIEEVEWMTAMVALELSVALAHLDTVAVFVTPVAPDGASVVEVVRGWSINACVRVAPRPSNWEDDDEWEATWTSAKAAVEPAIGFLTSALDAYCEGFAIRVVTVLSAFERWATNRGFDASVLLAARAPWISDKLTEHARWLDVAQPDEESVEQLLASLPTGPR